MRHRAPPPTPGVLAPHIPADTYRRAQATGEPIILIQPTPTVPAPPRSTARGCLFAVGVIVAGGIGGMGLVVAFLALLDIAAHTATAVGGALGTVGAGGITVKLTRPKAK
ncbi:hypothetical protein ACFWZT_03695 [Streptomyces alboflavus]|uniref:hypothetical protein n=1 Tax=Streptomyces alboflavus TaxID=67267 RepID=UPI00368DE8F3